MRRPSGMLAAGLVLAALYCGPAGGETPAPGRPLPDQRLFYDPDQETYFADGIDCEVDLAIASVSRDGRIIALDDGTRWEVDPADRAEAAAWLPEEPVGACGWGLSHLHHGRGVRARRLP